MRKTAIKATNCKSTGVLRTTPAAIDGTKARNSKATISENDGTAFVIPATQIPAKVIPRLVRSSPPEKNAAAKNNDDEASITISDPSGNTVTLNEAGITLSKAGQQIVIGDANVSVNDGALVVE